jgi:hypothetical protein
VKRALKVTNVTTKIQLLAFKFPFYFFWCYYGLNSGLRACKAGVLSLVPCLQSLNFLNTKSKMQVLFIVSFLTKFFYFLIRNQIFRKKFSHIYHCSLKGNIRKLLLPLNINGSHRFKNLFVGLEAWLK